MLEDTVAKYTVQIVQTGSTAPAVAEMNNLRAAAQATSTTFAATKTAAAETATSFENLGGKVYYLRSSIDAVRFAAMDGGARAGFYAIDEAIRAMLASGLKMSSMIPIFGGIAAAIGAGFLIWEEFGDHMESAEEKAKKLTDTLEKIPDLVRKVAEAQKLGAITPEQESQLDSYLSGKTPLYVNPTTPGDLTEQSRYAPSSKSRRVAPIDLDAATQEQIQTFVEKLREQFIAAAAKTVAGNEVADTIASEAKSSGRQAGQTVPSDPMLKVNDEQFNSIIKQMQDADALLKQENADTDKYLSTQKQLQDLENKITLSNLTGEAKKQEAIRETTQAMIQQITDIGKAAGLTDDEIKKLVSDAQAGAQKTQQAAVDAANGIKSAASMGVELEHNFEDGIASAMVDFADKTKTAKQAFEDFARSYLENAAKMLAQNALRGLFGQNSVNGSGGSGIFGAIFGAQGGIFPRMMADGGMAGMLSSATYFPRFNVVAGEAGSEMMAVLARPTFRSIGGMDAVVGNAGPNRLAIANADDLERGGRGAGGHMIIEVRGTPDFEGRVISNSIDGAEVRMTKNMTRNTKFRQAVRSGTTT